MEAGREELSDEPGRACWMRWTAYLIAAAAEVIGTASDPLGAPDNLLRFAACALRATCIQALALFGER